MKKIGILGTGPVAKALAHGFLSNGYPTMIGSRSESKLQQIASELGSKIKTGSFADTAAQSDIIVLAVKGKAAIQALDLAGRDNLDGKIVIDTTNPIEDQPPANGVLVYFNTSHGSLMESLQAYLPHARFVKCFSCVGSAHMVCPEFEEKPTMFICGNDVEAKHEVQQILHCFGWDAEDMGGVEAARAIEPLAILWCIPGFRENRWNHAFRLLKQ
jgi:predicted dinucleotide-binding enzyme